MLAYDEPPKHLEPALNEFRRGKLVLLHDSKSRENEVDMVVAAELASPEHVKVMRQDAGGLLCLALDQYVGEQLGLGFMREIFESSTKFPVLRNLIEETEPYGDKSAFSVTINHRRTFTGVTDSDRALTILQLGKLSRKVLQKRMDCKLEFVTEFKSPGHVHLLLESDGSLARRHGHTELSLYLCKLAGLTPAAAMCEMLDGKTYRALTLKDATSYAQKHHLPIIDGRELLTHYLNSQQHQSAMARVKA